MRAEKLAVKEEHEGERLDKWLSRHHAVSSRSRAADLITRGLVTVNGRPAKPSNKVRAGDAVDVRIPDAQPPTLTPLAEPLEILYEDDDLVVIDKPAGLVVHPAAGHSQDTLVNILLHHVPRLSMGFHEHRPGIVHRLDRDTSGLLVVAKNDRAHHDLARQFKDKSIHRVYWTLVHGIPARREGTISTVLARHPTDRKRFASSRTGKGKVAITSYKTLESRPSGISWLRCQLATGRTHQIRVHLSEAGHPVIGDVIYGRRAQTDRELGRLALHARELGFVHPASGRTMRFTLPWPDELEAFVRAKGFSHVPH